MQFELKNFYYTESKECMKSLVAEINSIFGSLLSNLIFVLTLIFIIV